MSQIEQFSDTGTIRNQTIPSGAVVGDLLFLNSSGWNLRTSVNDPIDGYISVADGTTSVITVGNGITHWSGGNSAGQIIYEDITNPAKTTVTPGGKIIGKIKGGQGGILAYELDSFLIECFGLEKPTIYAGNFITPGTIATTGTIVSSVTVNVTHPNTHFIFHINCDISSTVLDAVSMAIMEGTTTLFPNWTQTTDIPTTTNETNFVRSEVITLGVGTHTIDFVLYSTSGVAVAQNQGRAYIISQ